MFLRNGLKELLVFETVKLWLYK